MTYGDCTVEEAAKLDVVNLAPHLRKEDVAEIAAASGQSPGEALWLGLEKSDRCFAVRRQGHTIALFGTVPTRTPKVGAVWLLASDELFDIRFQLQRHAREWLTKLFEGYDLLGNLVDARNEKHVRWLRWLGFKFLRQTPAGRNGEVFIEFCRMRPN
jgi:hypothetical protein